jgi:hypothetical protein
MKLVISVIFEHESDEPDPFVAVRSLQRELEDVMADIDTYVDQEPARVSVEWVFDDDEQLPGPLDAAA